MRNKILLLLCFCFYLTSSSAQYIDEYPVNSGNGDLMISIKNYPEGIRIYKELIKKNPDNLEYRFKLGKCYTLSNLDKKLGLAYLKDLVEFDVKADDFKEMLGIANYKNYKFDEAKKIFNELLAVSTSGEDLTKYNDWLANCDRAKKMVKNPVAVSFENLGKYINSPAPDFFPIVKPNESNIYYSTRREGVVGNYNSYAGYKTADVFTAKHRLGRYSRARSVGSPNTPGNEFTAGRSENGSYLTYTVNSLDNIDDIFVSELGKRSYFPPKLLDNDEVNKKTSELGSTLTNDGMRMYFSSDRKGGYGGFDIYYIQRLPIGGWSIPVNVGSSINTAKDEKYPMLMEDGKMLYFSSNGHPGMGDMDLFKSKALDDLITWGKPVNLGYPINTPDDDLNISFAKNTRYAYMAKNLEDSFGDLDIYRLTFEKEKEVYSLLTGRVLDTDSAKLNVEVVVEIFKHKNGEFVGTYKASQKTGKYSAIVPPGLYDVEVSKVAGYAEYSKKVRIHGKNDQQKVKRLDILLESK